MKLMELTIARQLRRDGPFDAAKIGVSFAAQQVKLPKSLPANGVPRNSLASTFLSRTGTPLIQPR
jgi:hypothetical protein